METTTAALSSTVPVSEKDRLFFTDQGYLRLDGLLEEEERLWLLGLYDELFEKTDRKQLGGIDDEGRETLPQVLGPSKKVPELLETKFHARMATAARMLLGEEASYQSDHMILKPAGYGVATPWHQDQAYHDPRFRYRNVNFWMPLEDATIENGCMQYVPESHQGPVLPHTWLVPGDRKSAMVATDQEYWQANSVAVPCPAGSATLHHSYLMHHAGPNRTDRPRRAYIAVFSLPRTERERPWVFPWKA